MKVKGMRRAGLAKWSGALLAVVALASCSTEQTKEHETPAAQQHREAEEHQHGHEALEYERANEAEEVLRHRRAEEAANAAEGR